MRGTPTFEDSVVRAMAPASKTANTYAGDIIDRRGYDHVEFILNADVGAGTGGTVIGSVYESADSGMSGATLVTGATFTTLTSANEGVPRKGYIYGQPRLRYLRLTVVVAGQTSLVSAVCRLSGAAKEPIASPDFEVLS